MFSSSARQYLGVDIGATSIKVVELAAVRHAPELVTYGVAELPAALTLSDDEAVLRSVAATVTATCRKAGVSSRKAVAAVPSHLVFTSMISLPKLPRAELPAAVQREAEKISPLPLSEIRLQHSVLDEVGPGGETRVLLTGVPRKTVARYERIFRAAGLSLLCLETEGFALVRSLLGRDRATTAIIDMGDSSTDILVADRGVPFLSRSTEIGGQVVTEAMRRALDVPVADAEQIKYDLGVAALDQPPAPLEAALAETLAPIVNEVTYTLGLFREETGGDVEKVILAGGSAFLPNFAAHLSAVLNTRVYVGDPWARVRYPLELKGLLQESAARFAVAVGLAMREIR